MAGKHDGDKLDASLRFTREWQTYLSNIHGGTRAVGRNGIHAVYLRLKGDGRWLALAKRMDADTDQAQVAFGEGSTILSALKELNGAIAARRWRVDKPWRGPQ